MTLFLRDNNNVTYADIECWIKCEDEQTYVEISSSISIKEYSLLLLKTKGEKRISLISDFEILSELRGWLWERIFMSKRNTAKEFDSVLGMLREILDYIGERHGLHRVED